MPVLSNTERARLPARAFAYIDSAGRRRLPIHDESHVRNALSRFDQTEFESEEAREQARLRLVAAAKKCLRPSQRERSCVTSRGEPRVP